MFAPGKAPGQGAKQIMGISYELIRSNRQAAQWFALVDQPPIVFTARVNQSFSSYDQIAEITYDFEGITPQGVYMDILPDMTLLIGSTEGGHERGITRIRKAATDTILYIGEESQLAIQENDYLTVIGVFEPWVKHPKISENVIRMDFDIAYSNQHSQPDPVPVLGLDAIVELTGESVEVGFDGSDSYVITDDPLSFAWACATAAAVADEDTATPVFTFDTPGRHLVSCTVTVDATGKTTTGYRLVYVLDDSYRPLLEAEIEEIETDVEIGGPAVELTVYGDLAGVRPRAKAWIFSKDYFDLANQEHGPVSGREKLLFQGWITGENIEFGTKQSANLVIEGPQAFLDAVASFPASLEDTDWAGNGGGAANKWSEMQNLTVRKALWHYFAWRTTLLRITDVRITDDDREMAQILAGQDTVWGQIQEMAWETIFARPACDFLGRIYVDIEPQLIPLDEREELQVVMAITRNDMADAPIIERQIIAETCQVALTGSAYSGGNQLAVGGISPGNVLGPFGDVIEIGDLAFLSQDQAIVLAGAYYGWMVNELKEIKFTLAQINKFIDIAPRQYCTLSLAAEENNRGLEFSDLRIIPRQLTYRHYPETGSFVLEAVFEGESHLWHGVKYIFPGSSDPESPPIEPPEPPTPPEPPEPPLGGDCSVDLDAPENGPYRIGGASVLDSSGVEGPSELYLPKSCWVRDKDSTHDTKIVIDGSFWQWDSELGDWEGCLTTAHILVEALLSGAVVGTAIWNPTSYGYIQGPRSAWFSADPVDGSNASGFRIIIEPVMWTQAGAEILWVANNAHLEQGENVFTYEKIDFANWGWVVYSLVAEYTTILHDRLYLKIEMTSGDNGIANKLMDAAGVDGDFPGGYVPDLSNNTSGENFNVDDIKYIYGTDITEGTDLSILHYFRLVSGWDKGGIFKILEVGIHNEQFDTYTPFASLVAAAKIDINFVDLYNICESV